MSTYYGENDKFWLRQVTGDKMIDPIVKQLSREEFDYQTLLDVLKDYARPRDKISDLMRKGVIIRIKKGLYVLGEDYSRRPYSQELLANLIYGLDRFSEDLDFSLLFPTKDFDLPIYTRTLQRELTAFGFDARIEQRKKVEPFLRNPDVLKIWSHDFFHDVAKRIQPV